MLIPLGHDKPIRHAPWLTAAVIAAWVVIDLVRVARLPGRDEWRQARYQQARAEVVVLRRLGGDALPPPEPALREQAYERLDEARDADAEALLARMRAARPTITGQGLRAALDALAETDQRLTALARRDLAVRAAFRPADGLGPRVLLYAFVHAGWMHLAFAGLFLWLVGCNVEDRWGRGAYAAVLAGGALAGAAGHALAFPGSDAGLVGGSTAVAAAMGVFAVCFRDARLRFVRVGAPFARGPGAGVPAVVVLPLWFAGEVVTAFVDHARERPTGAAAHAAAFAFGALAAAALRASGVERRYLLPVTRRGVEWSEAPELVSALELVAADRRADAIEVLAAFVQRAPQHHAARAQLAQLALEAGRADLVAAHVSEALLELADSARPDEVVRLYRRLVEAMPAVAPNDRGLLEVARSAVTAGAPDLAADAAERLASTYPDSSVAPGALWLAARALGSRLDRWPRGDAGRRARAAALCRALVERYPHDPLAEVARARSATLAPPG